MSASESALREYAGTGRRKPKTQKKVIEKNVLRTPEANDGHLPQCGLFNAAEGIYTLSTNKSTEKTPPAMPAERIDFANTIVTIEVMLDSC